MRFSFHSARGRAALASGVAAIVAWTGAAAADAAPSKRPRSGGDAVVVSVDGPGRLTLKGSRGTFKTKLYGVDVPSPGECGATESTATLSRLAKRERGRVTYVLWGRKTDAEGRYSAIIGPRQTDLIENSIGRDLVESEWARAQLPVTISEMDDITMSVASDA